MVGVEEHATLHITATATAVQNAVVETNPLSQDFLLKMVHTQMESVQSHDGCVMCLLGTGSYDGITRQKRKHGIGTCTQPSTWRGIEINLLVALLLVIYIRSAPLFRLLLYTSYTSITPLKRKLFKK